MIVTARREVRNQLAVINDGIAIQVALISTNCFVIKNKITLDKQRWWEGNGNGKATVFQVKQNWKKNCYPRVYLIS